MDRIGEAIESMGTLILDKSIMLVHGEDIYLAIKSLKKQVPMVPKEVDEDYGYYICPACEFTVGYTDVKETHKYCLNCGQGLSWDNKDTERSQTMERLTEKTIGCFVYDLKNFKHKVGEFNDYDAFFAYSMAVKRLGELEDSLEPRPIEEWGEDYGDCLWWKFPIEEPPYCGTPLDSNFPDYVTHFTRLIVPFDLKG